jgi:hypothetical protein
LGRHVAVHEAHQLPRRRRLVGHRSMIAAPIGAARTASSRAAAPSVGSPRRRRFETVPVALEQLSEAQGGQVLQVRPDRLEPEG